MRPEVGAGWGPGQDKERMQRGPCLQLATAGNPQAKVNPALAETRTQGDEREK